MAKKQSKPKVIDIRKTGPQSYKTLQQENNPYGTSEFDNLAMPRQYTASDFVYTGYEMSPMQQSGNGYWGESMFDEETANEEDWQNNLQDIRANNQPWYAQLGAGIVKGAALAGTTFLDGTVGLLAGVAEMPNKGMSALWNNEFSNALADINQQMEQWLPNYKTQEEQERPWWQNLGTVNFWADSFIKNMGFTVGAFYSGAAWTKGLKALGILKGSTAAKGIGSALSAVNEGRIEANNGSREFLDLKYAEIEDATNRAYRDIMESQLSDTDKEIAINNVYARAEELKADAQNKADAMGLTTLMGNTVLLTLDNLWSFGKLYARGFKDAKGGLGSKMKNAITTGAEAEAAAAAGENVVKEGGKYAWKDITKGQAIRRGLTTGLVEGNEEMAQGAIQAFAGNRVSYDSPDAYYEALTNPDAQLKTKNTMTALTEAMKDTYGNGDRWEEFAVGFLTGIFGTPTFGKVANSDANTYLGRGKMIGMSGGLFGEIGVAGMRNREGRAAVETANKYMDKLRAKTGHFVQSTAFTDAMNGFAEEDDKFEFKNAEDNDDFAAISSFAKIGKLNDLKELVNQDFENMSDEQLADIAINTSRDFTMDSEGRANTTDAKGNTIQGGWRFSDGSLMSDSAEGREMMRNELKNKRDKILKEIDRYEDSVETVRAIGNNALDDDQVNELAWLHWKIGAFDERFKDIKQKSEGFLNDLEKSAQAFLRGRGRGMIDESTEEGQAQIKAMENTLKFIQLLRDSESALHLGNLIKNNPQFMEYIEEWAYPMLEGITGLDADTFEKGMRDLQDTTHIAIASQQFNDRFREYRQDPTKLIENRERIDAQQEKKATVQDKIDTKDKVHNASVSDLVNASDEGDIDLDQLEALYNASFEEEGTEETNTEGAEANPDVPQVEGEEGGAEQAGKKKIQEAKNIINTRNKAKQLLQQKKQQALDEDDTVTVQAIEDAQKMLENSSAVSESAEELLNVATEAYNNPDALDLGDIDSSILELAQSGMSQEEAEAAVAEATQERIDNAKTVMQEVSAELEQMQKQLDRMPKPETPSTEGGTEDRGEVGHDGVTKVKTENERQAEEAEKAEKEAAAKEDKNQREALEADTRADVINYSGGRKEAIHAFNGLVSAIDGAIADGLRGKELGETVKNTVSYQILKNTIGEENANKVLNKYYNGRAAQIKQAQAKQQEAKKAKYEELSLPTPDTSRADLDTAGDNINDNLVQSSSTETEQYWKPTTTELPIHAKKGDTTPFYILAKSLKKADGSPRYTPEQLKRMEAVYKYLKEKGAFDLVNNGGIQGERNKRLNAKDRNKVKGDEIHFVIDPALNEEAGEIIILLADSEGRIVGDLGSPNDAATANQVGLLDFHKLILEEYNKSGKAETKEIFTSSESTVADKNMIGKVPFLAKGEPRNTINQVFMDGNKEVPFQLGIAVGTGRNAKVLMTPGRTKDQGQSAKEKAIITPLVAVEGQPFLLMPTGDKTGNSKWICVPFLMPRYSRRLANTALGKALHDALELIRTNGSTPMTVVNALRDLIADRLYIEYSGKNNETVKVNLQLRGSKTQVTLYKGSVDAENMVAAIEEGLERNGVGFQVSRKYYNTTYRGQDYNRMIGEIAEVNLPIGATHTVNEWFTIKPITAQGTIGKANSPRTTGINPNATVVAPMRMNLKGVTYLVDTKTLKVTDENGNPVDTPESKVAAAHAYGIATSKNMNAPYDTELGYYDPRIGKFIEKKKKEDSDTEGVTIRTFGASSPLVKPVVAASTATQEDTDKGLNILIDDFQKKGITPEIEEWVNTTINQCLDILNNPDAGHVEIINAATKILNAVALMSARGKEEDVITKEQSKLIDDKLTEAFNEGFSYDMSTMTALDESKVNSIGKATEREDPNIPKGVKLIESVVRPAIYRNGVLIQRAIVKVVVGTGTTEVVESSSSSNEDEQDVFNEVRERLPFLKEATNDDIEEFFEHVAPAVEKAINNNRTEFEALVEACRNNQELPESLEALLVNIIQDAAPEKTIEDKEIINGFKLTIPILYDMYLEAEEERGQSPTSEDQSQASAQESSQPNQKLNVDTAEQSRSSQTVDQVIQEKSPEVKKQEDALADLEKAKKADLLNTPTRQAIWDSLTPAQQHELANRKVKQRTWMRTLEAAYDPSTGSFDEAVLGTSIDKFFDKPKFRRETDTQRRERLKREARKERKKELAWIKKNLPQLSHGDRLRLHKGLIKIADDENPGYAYGMFHRGIITLSDKAANGTLYHEAFHAVTDALLTEEERANMFNAAREKYGDLGELGLEEQLAEDFRRYVQAEQTPVIGALVRLFRTLKRFIQKLFGKKAYIDQVFYNINRNKYAGRELRDTDVVKYDINSREMEEIKQKAIADGTFMKAPNGRPSNLNERQWLQVRTKAFKNWFGDWENDPANASKVVDENGEPLVVYHQTGNQFTVFDVNRSEASSTDTATPFGVFTKPTADKIGLRGDIQMPLFNSMKSPLIVADRSVLEKVLREKSKEYNELLEEYDEKESILRKQLKEAREKSDFESSSSIRRQLKKLDEDYALKLKKAVNNMLEQNNYDGIILEKDEGGDNENVRAYISTNPNQLKSATDNIGTFSRNNDDIRYMMVGEKGARSLDAAEEATTRMDNLSTAAQMEKAGKDALTIKMATGWERGADGKWRYEIPDLKLKKDALGENEINAFYGNDKNSAITRPISEVVDLEFLPKTYREELEYVGEIKIYSDESNPERGSYDTKDGKIIFTLNLHPQGESVESILTHEIQHFIQDREGFSQGGNPNIAQEAYLKQHGLYETYNQLLEDAGLYNREVMRVLREDEEYRKYENMSRQLDMVLDMVDINDSEEAIEDFIKGMIPNWKPGVSYDNLAEQRKEKVLKEHEKELKEAERKSNEASKKLEDIRKKMPASYDAYRNLAGEVEARTASNRIRLSMEERRNSLFTDDMYKDVAKEDLIFLQKGLSDSNDMAPGFRGTVNEFQEIVESNINNSTFRWKNQIAKDRAWGNLVDLWFRNGYEVRGKKDKYGNWHVTSAKPVSRESSSIGPKYRRVEVNTPIKDEYKGKLIYAQSGTGKTTIADNINVIDSDSILAELLGVETNQAGTAFGKLSFEEKSEIATLYRTAIRQKVAEGKTVITANNSMLDDADLIVYNESAELATQRTSGITRTNPFANMEYQNETLNTIKEYLANNNKESVALTEGKYLGDVLLKDPSFNIGNARIIANNPTLVSLMEDFLGQFGITFDEFNGEGYSIDYLEKVISGATDEDKIEGASEMIAFMMQHNVRPLIAQMAVEDGVIDADSMYFPEGHKNAGRVNDRVYKQLDRRKYIKVLAQSIKDELEYQYGVIRGTREENKDRYKNSFWKKILDIITKFFEKIISNKPLIDGIRDYARYVATNVMQQNKGLITASITKPGDKSGQIVRPVDVRTAMQQFPYEYDIVKKMSSVGISLAGSTSMAIQGTVFRPLENPLHDLDFGTPDNTTRESLEKLIVPLFDNLQHLRMIDNGGGAITETYVTLNEPFTIEALPGLQYKLYDSSGNQIAHIDKSDLIYDKPGVRGKILDFFTGTVREYPLVPYQVGNDVIYMNNYREAIAAKVDWKRLKDIFDFNRFIPFYKMSPEELQQYESTLERIEKIRQYYRDKRLYANLSEEDKQYLRDKHITIQEYNNMTEEEKEVLFKCKGW